MSQVTKVKQIISDDVINLAIDTINRGKQALVFVNSKQSAQKVARDIAKQLKKQKYSENINLSDKIKKVLSHPTKQCEDLSNSVKYSIAFHHSGLHSKQRELVESSFLRGEVKIIAATPTLAAGMNLPAFRTILKDLKRFSGWGMSYIPVLEYLQQAGRAGRPGFDDYGESIIITKDESEKAEVFDRYICGVPEDITSKLAVLPVLRTYVLSLIATGFTKTKKELIEFFKKTFWAKQYGDMFDLIQKIESVLNDLIEFEFVIKNGKSYTKNDEAKNLFSNAVDLIKKDSDKEILKATIIGQRVSELYIDPDAANEIIQALKKADTNTSTLSYLLSLCLTNEIRSMFSIKKAEYEELVSLCIKDSDDYICEMPDISSDDFLLFLNKFKVAHVVDLWINECDEDSLFKKYKVRPGEIHELVNRLDWLIYGAASLASLIGNKSINPNLNRLRKRIKYGVKEELLFLLEIQGIGKVRARKLYSAGISTLSDLKKTSLDALSSLLGVKVAYSVRKFLGFKDPEPEVKLKKTKTKENTSKNNLLDYF